ncbi:ABC transporter permease [Actimicrobium sp. CCI2.3]|uniref:ABC transporter permease n=1 Tax=Actimicrobium sp. CCI2.3 TaxID=3048616 RepID=UPI002AB3D6F6|nr:ABC transporter permease [Actimicrobium sp. CCI2.3]MDY7573966.1 ABC transporter permease [Actimicrobium sp. CCI2.3]MEB0023097.1 ABC transporter permease [Actimicrobium sp. CCI2.3]
MSALTQTPLRRSLTIQARVIGALLMREVITRYGRHNIGFLWLFVEPMMFTLGVTALWNATKATHGSSLSITAFAVTGYSSVLLWRNTVMRCSGAITPNLSLMYHRNVRVIDLFASRIILEMAGATISFVVLTLFFSAIGWMALPDDVLKMAFGWALLAWFGAALALTIGALSERSELVEKIWHPVSYLLFPLSGAAFMVDWLPSSAQTVVLWLPMVHGVEILREGYFGKAVHAHYDVAYMSFINLCLTLLGLALVREAGRRVEPE